MANTAGKTYHKEGKIKMTANGKYIQNHFDGILSETVSEFANIPD